MGAPARRTLLIGAALALLSTLLTWATLEGVLRLWRGERIQAIQDYRAIRMLGTYPAAWDAGLGHIPEPGYSGLDNPWRKRVSIDAHGLRRNGGPEPGGPAVLALGDSFVFGDEVADRDTWPAALERHLGRRVHNGGVFGYGLDQIALRAEALLERLDVAQLVVSVIPDDVARCEYAFRFGHKPWFDLAEGRLTLHNVPTPRPEDPPPGSTALWGLLQRSALAEFVIHRLDPLGRPVRGSVRVHREGGPVSVALMDRMAEASRAEGSDLLLVLAWHPGAATDTLAPLRRRAVELGVPLLDLEPIIRDAMEAQGGDWTRLFHAVAQGGARQPGHMSARGNDLVARSIAARLNGG